ITKGVHFEGGGLTALVVIRAGNRTRRRSELFSQAANIGGVNPGLELEITRSRVLSMSDVAGAVAQNDLITIAQSGKGLFGGQGIVGGRDRRGIVGDGASGRD